MAGQSGLSPAMLPAFLDGPSTPAPAGITPNSDNARRSPGIFAFAVLCLCMVAVAVAARLYSRIVVARKFHVEDCLGFMGFLAFVAFSWAVFAFNRQDGFRTHQWDLTGRKLVKLALVTWISAISYCLTMLFLKTAILLEWMRIFAFHLTARKAYWLSIALIIFNVGVYFGGTFVVIFQCKPVDKSWHIWLDGKCADRKWRNSVSAGMNAVIDIFIFILPQRTIWGLHMGRMRKVGVSIVFSIGLLVIATATGRFYATLTMDEITSLQKTTDWTYTFSRMMLWSFAELTCIFFVFCVPAFPKLVREDRYITYMRTTLRHWTGKKSKSSGNDSKTTSWPRTIGGASSKRPGRSVDDLFNTQSSLTELSVIPTTDNGSGKLDGCPRLDGITKTVEYGHQDEEASDSSNNLFADYQRNWVGY